MPRPAPSPASARQGPVLSHLGPWEKPHISSVGKQRAAGGQGVGAPATDTGGGRACGEWGVLSAIIGRLDSATPPPAIPHQRPATTHWAGGRWVGTGWAAGGAAQPFDLARSCMRRVMLGGLVPVARHPKLNHHLWRASGGETHTQNKNAQHTPSLLQVQNRNPKALSPTSAADCNGRTALAFAKARLHFGIASLLRAAGGIEGNNNTCCIIN